MYLFGTETLNYIMHIKASVALMTIRFTCKKLMATVKTLKDVLNIAFLCGITSDTSFRLYDKLLAKNKGFSNIRWNCPYK